MRRVFVTLLFVYMGLSALTGCAPKFQGSLTGRDGNGGPPTPLVGQPQITSVSPFTAVAGSASFTLTVNGLNFVPTTTVLWDGFTSLTTTYVSSTVLQAQVPTLLIPRPTTVYIIPSPSGPFNFGANFTVTAASLTGNNSFSVAKVPVHANDMAWNEANQQLYLSVASANGTNANTITSLNPQAGALGSSVSSGTEPNRLAISGDGSYLYAALDSAGSVRRYTLPALQPDIDIPLGSGANGPYSALDLEVQPGNSSSVAVARGIKTLFPREVGGILIYDNTVARPQSVPGFGPIVGSIDSLFWNPNGQTLYGIGSLSGDSAYVMSISSAGVQLQTQTSMAASSYFQHFHFDSTTGNIYSDIGQVINPLTGAVIELFPVNAIQGGFGGMSVMVPDGKLNIAYFLGQTVDGGGTGNYVIEAFDLTNFTLLGAIPITNVSGTPSKIIRWGNNGLAFLTGGLDGKSSAGDGVYLVSGGFVTSPAP